MDRRQEPSSFQLSPWWSQWQRALRILSRMPEARLGYHSASGRVGRSTPSDFRSKSPAKAREAAMRDGEAHWPAQDAPSAASTFSVPPDAAAATNEDAVAVRRRAMLQ
ncbi:unnamed protein product [Polarella glacialis]|uniref:Uncharacterized protein n=1 Tax=Polarella glacialis TaxID=89957 RepID=A0A813IT25_POLGL|nr:unnamed protein product [Polarella glacialis]CAE8660304.1 unnamed protein product [Polarella glacialis]